ncbi:hypothetical protein SO802_006669 [Lithocarpus litseifolius]|uniref:Protein kinase domain-containing protein n=1 Tax=Lithocarpus litseifolius TaxID=425828 RepID=A0AAW2DMD8_9ROSI
MMSSMRAMLDRLTPGVDFSGSLRCLVMRRRGALRMNTIKIGQGTYSTVYRARDLETNRLVALKKYFTTKPLPCDPSTLMSGFETRKLEGPGENVRVRLSGVEEDILSGFVLSSIWML